MRVSVQSAGLHPGLRRGAGRSRLRRRRSGCDGNGCVAFAQGDGRVCGSPGADGEAGALEALAANASANAGLVAEGGGRLAWGRLDWAHPNDVSPAVAAAAREATIFAAADRALFRPVPTLPYGLGQLQSSMTRNSTRPCSEPWTSYWRGQGGDASSSRSSLGYSILRLPVPLGGAVQLQTQLSCG